MAYAQTYFQPIIPRPGESLAITEKQPKAAALAFDRVYRIPVLNEPVPEEIGFFGATDTEIQAFMVPLVLLALGPNFEIRPVEGTPPDDPIDSLRWLASEVGPAVHCEPTPLYPSQDLMNADFPKGARQVLAAAISNIALADESALEWAQVMEFRRDKAARQKYRRLVRWLDTELQAKDPSQVVSHMEQRLEDYEWALKKHGITTAIGVLSCLIDPKFLGTSAAAVAAVTAGAGGIWGALAGTTLAIGRSLATFGTTYLANADDLRQRRGELAYVHDIRKKV